MNYGKKSASKKRNSLISRSSMMGKRAHVSFIRVLFIGLIALCVAVSSLGIRFHSWNTCKYAGRK